MYTELEKTRTNDMEKMIEHLSKFNAQIVNDQNCKSRKKAVKSTKNLTAAHLVAIKEKFVRKNAILKDKPAQSDNKQKGKKVQKEKLKKNKVQVDNKPNTAPARVIREPSEFKGVRNNFNPEKLKLDKEKPADIMPLADPTEKIFKKSFNVTQSATPHTASKSKRLPDFSITKKDREKLKQEMKSKIENLPSAPFKAKKLDEETIASVRKALSTLVDKALDTLQTIPREKLKAASMNLQKSNIKLKSGTKCLLRGDPKAQIQSKFKEKVMKELKEYMGGDIVNRSKNV